MKFRNVILTGSAIVAVAAFGTSASAFGVITDPTTSYGVGIGNNGELYDGNSGVGFQRLADGYDPLAPGSPRDSWGVETTFGSAYADDFYYGVQNITGTNIALAANSGTAASTTTVGVNVTQAYTFVAPNILKIAETVTNTSGVTLSGTLFQRDIDWDVTPTEFDENTVGPFGPGNASVVDSSYYGFEDPDPSAPYGLSCFAGCNSTGDLGGGIDVALPVIGANDSYTFDYYYGISQFGQSLDGLVAQAVGVGADYIIGTQSSENGAYPSLGYDSAFIGVGPSGVPEPASWALMMIGVGGIGAVIRSGKARRAASLA